MSLFTAQYSLLPATHYLTLPTHYSLLTTHYLHFTTHWPTTYYLPLTVEQAISLVMGANIGTSVTSTIVAVTQSRCG